MARDRIERIKLSIGKKAAAFSRLAALKLEVHRLRLEARTLRAETRQTGREMQAELSQAAEKSYEAWKAEEEWENGMREAFWRARELEDSIHERNAEAERLEETAQELKSIRNAEKEEKAAEVEKKETVRESGANEKAVEDTGKIDGNEEKDEAGSGQEKAVCVCPSCKASYGKKVNYCRLCGTAIQSDPD